MSIIILNWNTRDLLVECLLSAEKQAGHLEIELIVVDNASTDDSLTVLQRDFPQVKVVASQVNVGFAAGNNLGVKEARGRYFLLLNTDAFLEPGALSKMVTLLDSSPDAGLCGARLINRDGSFQASHTSFPSLASEFLIRSGLGRLLNGRHYPSRGPDRARGPRPVDYVEGACLLCRPAAYEQVGGLDASFFMYAEEVDLCMALHRAGWTVWYHPEAEVIHFGGASSSSRRPEREGDLYASTVRYFNKHHGRSMASLVAAQIIGFTALKAMFHGTLRLLTGGRHGRPVVSIRRLSEELWGDQA